MAKYNTRNPVGSTDPRDLYDNASNLDELVNGEKPFVEDRLGKQRESWSGMEYNFNAAIDGWEDRFQQFLLSSGYVSLGNYNAGITFEARNQYVVYEGQFYRPAAATALPYTTSGDWGVDGPAMVLLGDDVLRQELADPDKGAAMVARGVVAVDSIADLLALPEVQRREGLRYMVRGYYADNDLGGGQFYWDANRDKSEANGGTILDPVSIGSFDGTASTLPDLLITQGQASGGGVWVKVTNGSYSPYEFGYAGTYESGMWSCSHIIELCKNLGGGTLDMPAERFYLGGQPQYGYFKGLSYVEAGDNLTWHVPAGSVVELMGTFGVVWRPTGFGYEGGRKNFHMHGGGKFEGASRDPSDACFLSLNAMHVTGFRVQDITFQEVAAGHIMDLMGVRDVYVDGVEFIGSCLDFRGARAGVEYIQIDFTSSAGRRYIIEEDNQWMDYLACSNLNFTNLKFRAHRDEDGVVLSYPQISLGAHGHSAANVDSIIISDIHIEQTDPNSVLDRQNYAALRLPPCDYLLVDRVTYRVFGEGTLPDSSNTDFAFLMYTYNPEYTRVNTASTDPAALPIYETVPRPEPTKDIVFKNLVVHMDHPKPLEGGVQFGRVIISPVSCTVEGFTFFGNPNSTVREGYDIFAFGRWGGGFGEGVEEADPVFNVSNVRAYGNFQNFIIQPERGRFVFNDVYAEGNDFSFRGMADHTKIELLKMDNFTLRSKTVTGQSTSAFQCARLEITNSSLDTLGLRSILPDTTGYVLNNVLPSGLPESWTNNPNIQFEGNVLIDP